MHSFTNTMLYATFWAPSSRFFVGLQQQNLPYIKQNDALVIGFLSLLFVYGKKIDTDRAGRDEMMRFKQRPLVQF